MGETMEPQALQILSNDHNKILLNEEALCQILSRDEIKDRNICVISVSGVFRQGKSFLLNFLLRYLRVTYLQQRDITEWLSPEYGPLKGFSWAPGSKRHTTGIHMWSEVFLGKLPTGEEVAIILLDTQGASDNQSSISDCATIFALSTLISSVQIYNVMRLITQCDLTHLQCFGGCGKLISGNGTAPFQNLIFLVRDWPCPYEKPYGSEGGGQLLNEVFEVKGIPEVDAQVENIKELFSDVSCFLLPYPGRTVDTSKTFDGNLNEIDEEFKNHVQEFVSSILSPEKLVMKTVHGEKITAGDLVHYIREYCSVLKDGSVPQVTTVFKASFEAHYKAAVYRSVKFYKKLMDCDCKTNPKCYSQKELEDINAANKLKVAEYYRKLLKFDDPELSDQYIKQLQLELDEEFKEYKKINDRKLRALEEAKKRELQRREIQRINRQASSSRGASSSSSSDMAMSNTEIVGTAVAVIGGIAALAFGASKFFTPRGNND